jgi:hypothetical protein
MPVKKSPAKTATVCLEGYKISKNGHCVKDKKYVKAPRKNLPKSATVCLEGYKISKAGRCIKDKKYVSYVTSIKSASVPIAPVICPEGYKFSMVTGKCRKVTIRAPTVCIEGYKMTKDGRCIKDKAYSLLLSTVPKAVAPAATLEEAKDEAYESYMRGRVNDEDSAQPHLPIKYSFPEAEFEF